MEHSDLLRDLLILFGFATLVAVLLQKARQSTIVAYLLTGVLVGPSGLGLITNRQAIERMAEIGVILLLFSIGIEFSLERLLRMRHVMLGAGSRQVGITILLILSMALLLGYPWRQSLFWGFLVAASSTAIVLKLLFERRELESTHGRAIMGVLLFQDLCVVPMMAILPALSAPTSSVALSVLMALGKALAVVALILVVAHYVFPPLWRSIVQLRNKEIFLIATIFFSLGTAWVSGQLGLSLALGAFLAGLALSESEFAHQILSEILPFRDSFNSLFFISVGMLLNLGLLRTQGGMVAALALGILLVKSLTGATAVLSLRFPLRMSLLVGLALAQVGEFSFILLHQGASLNLIDEGSYQTFLAAAVLTMLATPVVVHFSPRLAAQFAERERLARFFPGRGDTDLEQQAAPLADHVILCGYGLNGQLTARILRRMQIAYIVLETNPDTVRRAAAAGEPIFFGDATGQQILAQAGADRARAVVFAISDPFALNRAVASARAVAPHTHVVVRAKRVDEAPALERAGASEVVSEELEAAEEIILRVLNIYGIPRSRGFELLKSEPVPEEATRVE